MKYYKFIRILYIEKNSTEENESNHVTNIPYPNNSPQMGKKILTRIEPMQYFS